MNAATPLLEIDIWSSRSVDAGAAWLFDACRRGAMVSLVGRNGAGKTTLMRSIMGHLNPAQGAIRFEGVDLSARPRHARAPSDRLHAEDRCLVPQLTVEETSCCRYGSQSTSTARRGSTSCTG